MAFFDELSKKAKDVAVVAADKAKDVADKAKINMAIAGEQREIEKNHCAIGEWFVSEYEGEIPGDVRALVEAVNAAKARIAELEAAKSEKDDRDDEPETAQKVCPICGAASDSKFCPQCGAPMGE